MFSEYFWMAEEPLQTADVDPPLGPSAGESLSSLPICSSLCHVDGNRAGCPLPLRPSVKLSGSGGVASGDTTASPPLVCVSIH